MLFVNLYINIVGSIIAFALCNAAYEYVRREKR